MNRSAFCLKLHYGTHSGVHRRSTCTRWKYDITIQHTHNLNNFQDVVTDLNAEGEPLPIRPINEDWLGHKVRFSIM